MLATGLVCLSVALCAGLFYRYTRSDLEQRIGSELVAIASSASALVEAERVERVDSAEGGRVESAAEFEALRSQLDRIRQANRLPQANSIYILRPAGDFDTTGLLELVATPDHNGLGVYPVGAMRPARPHHRLALEGVTAVSEIHRDATGDDAEVTRVSASAPLYTRAGRLVGLVQVDRHVGSVSADMRTRALEIGWVALLAATAGMVLSALLARSVMRPLAEITDGARALARGELGRRLGMKRRDEIGDLAAGFDVMAQSLEERTTALEAAREDAKTAALAMIISGRLAAVGQLAAGVAHEINNPLAYVRSNLNQLRACWGELGMRRSEDPRPTLDPADAGEQNLVGEGFEILEETMEGVDRAVAIVRDIRGLAHAGTQDRELVELDRLCDVVLRVASPQLGPGIAIERAYGEPRKVLCSGQEIQQVLLNLVLNAAHAMKGSGTLRIETDACADCGVVRVIDDGSGIGPELLSRLFDPFFTTKPVGEGTGLGLSISHEIVRRHRGELLVTSKPGAGSTFEVRLPFAPGSP